MGSTKSIGPQEGQISWAKPDLCLLQRYAQLSRNTFEKLRPMLYYKVLPVGTRLTTLHAGRGAYITQLAPVRSYSLAYASSSHLSCNAYKSRKQSRSKVANNSTLRHSASRQAKHAIVSITTVKDLPRSTTDGTVGIRNRSTGMESNLGALGLNSKLHLDTAQFFLAQKQHQR